MNHLQALNKRTAPKGNMPERIIQFGEGNFLRAFVDWIIYNMNQKTDFNSSVVVVQPIERGMVDWLNGQDGLYHVNLQGKENGQPVNTLTRVDVISRALNPYTQNQAFMALAEQPEMRFIISNTTEAGIAFDDNSKPSDAPAPSLQVLWRMPVQRYDYHALRTYLPERTPPERLHLQIHRALEGRHGSRL